MLAFGGANMSLKRKPTIIKFDGEDEKQKFFNWALGKSQPSKGVNKAKAAMKLAQKNTELNSKRSQLTEKVEIEVSRSPYTSHLKISSSRESLREIRVKRKRQRNGTHAFTSNNRRG